jgi:predicted dehydrogenase
MDRPQGSDPVPAGLEWDLWLGPAPTRPFKRGVYLPFSWRGWQDFGTGALGDMACHTVNMPFRALELGYPTTIEAESGGMNTETYPLSSKIRFQFPARTGQSGSSLPAVTLWWYEGGKPKPDEPRRHDGSNKPPRDLLVDVEAARGEVPGAGCLIVGDKGKIFAPDDYGTQFFVKLSGEEKFTFFKKHPAVDGIAQTIPRNPFEGDADFRQHAEWLAAIKDGKPERCYSRFDIAASLTEIMLLGCVALRAGRKLEWDGPGMRATNAPEAARFIRRENRQGWA